MDKRINFSVVAVIFTLGLLTSNACLADTYFEVGVGASQHNLSITRKRAEDFKDESAAVNLSFAAYRESSLNSYWGAVIELVEPQGRDGAHPGSGRLLGFRPINYLRFINDYLSFELYAGAAQYDWRQTANGYYFGTSVRYNFKNSHWSVAFDSKYYQDLAFDSPAGDDIVDGLNPGLKVFYRF